MTCIHRAQLSSYSRSQFGEPYCRPFSQLLLSNTRRALRIMRRNRGFWLPRIIQGVFLGCVLGGLFYDLPATAFQARLGLCLCVAMKSAKRTLR